MRRSVGGGDAARLLPGITPGVRLVARRQSKSGVRILTIGYEGSTPEQFLDTLRRTGVSLLLDVRELPISRRRGFAKTALSMALEDAGIDYEHDRALGAPREIRHRLREDGDLRRYFADFREYLATRKGHLDELSARLSGAVALMCFERNPAECHRSVVASALARRLGCEVEHLEVARHGKAPIRPGTHPRQGVPAT